MKNQERSPPLHSLSLETFFHVLSDRTRRAVLAVLANRGRRMTVNDLTKAIVARQYEMEITDVPGDAVIDLFISLYHNHIPRLAETPLIEYDVERTLVEPTETLVELEPLLSLFAETDSVQSLVEGIGSFDTSRL